MNWYIGQEIVCIKTHSSNLIKEGEVFTIRALDKKCCQITIDVGISNEYDLMRCVICRNVYKTQGNCLFGERLFAPLDTLTDITEIEELLKEPLKIIL